MSGAIHLISKAVPGHGATDGSYLPCSGVSGTAVSVSPYSSRAQYKPTLKVNNLSWQCTSRNSAAMCSVNSGGHKRNPDFSRQNKHGFSRSRNRQNENRDHYENLEESEVFSSKNGPLLTSSGSPKFQATAAPGPREKEIVELFRKVQAQLRERAAVKEERKIESHKKGKESETVDSLLKLLRKHSVQQGKRSSDSDSGRDFISNQPERSSMFSEERNTSIFDSNSGARHEKQENVAVTSRPRSKFQRRSPVPQAKAQPTYFDEDNINLISRTNLDGKGKQETLEPELEVEPEAESDNESAFSDAGAFDDMSDDEISEIYEDDNSDVSHQNEGIDGSLSEMKLTELRALAKSRGLRGFSKLKKHELIDLLSGSSV